MTPTTLSDHSTRTLSNLADSGFDQSVLEAVSLRVNFALSGVRGDVHTWICWMLVGGSRPRANKRTTSAGGVNAIRVTQDSLCEALEPYYDLFDMGNQHHFSLLERITRPLPPNAR